MLLEETQEFLWGR
jgi:hypothetical protein